MILTTIPSIDYLVMQGEAAPARCCRPKEREPAVSPSSVTRTAARRALMTARGAAGDTLARFADLSELDRAQRRVQRRQHVVVDVHKVPDLGGA